MPFIRFTVGTVNQRTFQGMPLPPGVLTHAMLHVHGNAVQPGDIWATMYLSLTNDPTIAPYAQLASGLITLANPLTWQGALTIDAPSQLRALLIGYQADDFTLSYSRLTITNPHEVGDYERSLRQ